MDKQGKQTKTGAPLFDGLTYTFWNVRMRVFLQAYGVDVWKEVVNGYNVPTTPLIDNSRKKLYEDNSKAMNAILSGMAKIVFVNIMHCETTKEIWDKIKNIYGGDDKVKGAKLQTYRGQFENLKMKDEENIATYFLRVDEIVNIIRGLAKKIEESIIVQKIPTHEI